MENTALTVVTIVVGDAGAPVVTGNDVPKHRALVVAQVLASLQSQLLALAATPDRDDPVTEPVDTPADVSSNSH